MIGHNYIHVTIFYLFNFAIIYGIIIMSLWTSRTVCKEEGHHGRHDGRDYICE